MHVILWEFSVREEFIAEFTKAYGSNGDWADLFMQSEGYLGTELLRSSEDANVFLTIDRWESAACFERFQKQFGAAYMELDSRLEGYTSSEKKIGVFSEV
jgi:heme-degrading monooxygenase HmoA